MLVNLEILALGEASEGGWAVKASAEGSGRPGGRLAEGCAEGRPKMGLRCLFALLHLTPDHKLL